MNLAFNADQVRRFDLLLPPMLADNISVLIYAGARYLSVCAQLLGVCGTIRP